MYNVQCVTLLDGPSCELVSWVTPCHADTKGITFWAQADGFGLELLAVVRRKLVAAAGGQLRTPYEDGLSRLFWRK